MMTVTKNHMFSDFQYNTPKFELKHLICVYKHIELGFDTILINFV